MKKIIIYLCVFFTALYTALSVYFAMTEKWDDTEVAAVIIGRNASLNGQSDIINRLLKCVGDDYYKNKLYSQKLVALLAENKTGEYHTELEKYKDVCDSNEFYFLYYVFKFKRGEFKFGDVSPSVAKLNSSHDRFLLLEQLFNLAIQTDDSILYKSVAWSFNEEAKRADYFMLSTFIPKAIEGALKFGDFNNAEKLLLKSSHSEARTISIFSDIKSKETAEFYRKMSAKYPAPKRVPAIAMQAEFKKIPLLMKQAAEAYSLVLNNRQYMLEKSFWWLERLSVSQLTGQRRVFQYALCSYIFMQNNDASSSDIYAKKTLDLDLKDMNCDYAEYVSFSAYALSKAGRRNEAFSMLDKLPYTAGSAKIIKKCADEISKDPDMAYKMLNFIESLQSPWERIKSSLRIYGICRGISFFM